MKKLLLTISAISMVFAINACDSVKPAPDLGLKRPSRDQLVAEAASKCETLGFEKGTKEYRDCAVTQFNKMQDKYY